MTSSSVGCVLTVECTLQEIILLDPVKRHAPGSGGSALAPGYTANASAEPLVEVRLHEAPGAHVLGLLLDPARFRIRVRLELLSDLLEGERVELLDANERHASQLA